VFEDFVFGFIDNEISLIAAKSQKSDTYLAEERKFRLKPDLYIRTEHEAIIADTKYKIIDREQEKTGGISQNDLYQMVAYAIRFETESVLLYFPNILEGPPISLPPITIEDKLSNNRKIVIFPTVLSIINNDLFTTGITFDKVLKTMFDSTANRLKEEILQSINNPNGL